jgi:hypothetical protein
MEVLEEIYLIFIDYRLLFSDKTRELQNMG